MEFKISLDWNRKKSITPTTTPEDWGGSTFYPINVTSEQNAEALILMYNDLPEVQAPINFIIDSLSIIPYMHTRNDKEVNDSKVISLLKKPNQYQTENDFIKLFFLNRIALGAGYINRIKPIGFRTTKQLYVLPTQNTEPVIEVVSKNDYRLNTIQGYITSFGGSEITIDKDSVFVQRETSLIDNNYYESRSRLMSAIMTSDSLRNNYHARIKLLKDRGAVGLITPSDPNTTLTKDEANRLREQFYEGSGLTGNKYPFHIGGRSMNYTSTSMNASELELINNKNKDFEIVCNVLGLDPALFGLGNNTYNNKKLAKTSFYEDVIIPYFDNYLQLLSNIFELPKNEKLVADYSQIAAMQEDYEKLVNANTKLWNDGLITEAEAREATGFEGGEEKKKNELSTNVNQENE